MDFRFRAINNKPPAAPSSSGCSSDHPLRGSLAYLEAPSSSGGCSDHPLRDWLAYLEAPSSSGFSSDHLQRDDSLNAELVKQRIKEEIMIREIASRRMLEAEIRRELIIEQELAKHRAASRTDQCRMDQGLGFDDKFAMRLLDPRLNRIVDQYTGGLLGSTSLNSSVRPFAEPQKEVSKPLEDEKDKLIFLSKPDPEKFEAKRKLEGPPAQGDTGPFPWKLKKAKEEFVCRMCKVSATSEISFNAHLQGKKHRAKEGGGLRAAEMHKGASPTEKSKGLEEEDDSKNTGRAAVAEPIKKNGFKFWCEICQIGTQSMVVMEMHNNGKKHRACLLKFGEHCKDEQRKSPRVNVTKQ